MPDHPWQADGAAVDAMRTFLATVAFDGVIVIGEGEKDEAPMLFNGERVGDGNGPQCDVAVDPIDGTTLMAEGRSNQGIADHLVITLRAAEKYVSSIFTKLDLPSTGSDSRRVLAVLLYLRN